MPAIKTGKGCLPYTAIPAWVVDGHIRATNRLMDGRPLDDTDREAIAAMRWIRRVEEGDYPTRREVGLWLGKSSSTAQAVLLRWASMGFLINRASAEQKLHGDRTKAAQRPNKSCTENADSTPENDDSLNESCTAAEQKLHGDRTKAAPSRERVKTASEPEPEPETKPEEKPQPEPPLPPAVENSALPTTETATTAGGGLDVIRQDLALAEAQAGIELGRVVANSPKFASETAAGLGQRIRTAARRRGSTEPPTAEIVRAVRLVQARPDLDGAGVLVSGRAFDPETGVCTITPPTVPKPADTAQAAPSSAGPLYRPPALVPRQPSPPTVAPPRAATHGQPSPLAGVLGSVMPSAPTVVGSAVVATDEEPRPAPRWPTETRDWVKARQAAWDAMTPDERRRRTHNALSRVQEIDDESGALARQFAESRCWFTSTIFRSIEGD